MTQDSFPKTLSGRIIETGKIVGAVGVILSGCVGVWAGTVGPVAEFFERIDRLVDDVDQLREDVARANGEDRVIRQPPGQSYVEEPVRQGENIVLWLTVQRTTLGRDCRLQSWVPLFSDNTNVPIPGRRAGPDGVRRQISDDLEKLRIELIPPQILSPGRIELFLSLTYTCGDKAVPDKTRVVAYRLLPVT